VIPLPMPTSELEITFPRIRGGDPNAQTTTGAGGSFSPHTRG